MIQLPYRLNFNYKRTGIFVLIGILLAGMMSLGVGGRPAQAAACVDPGTDYGTVTHTINVEESGTYRVWTRMAAPNSSANTYLLEVDGSDCYEVGGSGVPVYASPSGPYFVSDASNWQYRTASNTPIDISLSAGSHTLELIGAHADVVVDRIILTRDTDCVPRGVGDNCATEFLAADLNEDGVINFLDVSLLASTYGQSGGSLGRSDINGDDVVDYQDVSVLSLRYGE